MEREKQQEPWTSDPVPFRLTDSGWEFTGTNWALPNLGFVLIPLLLMAGFTYSLLASDTPTPPRSPFQLMLTAHVLVLVFVALGSFGCFGWFVSFGKMVVKFDGEKYTIFEGLGTIGVMRHVDKREVRSVALVYMGKQRFGIYLLGLKKTIVGQYLNKESQVFLAEVWQAMLESCADRMQNDLSNKQASAQDRDSHGWQSRTADVRRPPLPGRIADVRRPPLPGRIA